ncbi:HNH endonuclease [Rufibacter glacialis]|uniref:DUF3427 domain-containing protein n=1 Tax=Rufibacter glacialis TaxID=1259555 RepID=A0A5M8Q9W9_9BACT|nr:HNH endonuclease [Rufibacter glacialis]KAA6431871.1 DUF3427 domain-containing protein [Rufibacter glacialis]GGK80799.1 hypothetical protein GCM10011405_30720 [Rufibacter glacialis]
MRVFDKDDRDYLSWMNANPAAFVVNTERRGNSRYYVIHRSGCPHIAITSGQTYGAFTERNYIKLCSHDPGEIEGWLQQERPNFISITKECKTCAPSTGDGALSNSQATVSFENIGIGERYDRNVLASLWGYQGRQAISRGVVAPANSKSIILFVTSEKQASLTQYNDYISADYLYWEGEEKGRSNNRILNAKQAGDTIHLFYREKHHTDFTYMGLLELESADVFTTPMSAVFRIIGSADTEILDPVLPLPSNVHATTRQSIVSSRVGQGIYRQNLVRLWQTCAVTGAGPLGILVASHIKPWRDCDNMQRLDPYNGLLLTPNLDSLFDNGYISFQGDGTIIISKSLSYQSCKLLNITLGMRLRRVYPQNLSYLEYHREEVFRK